MTELAKRLLEWIPQWRAAAPGRMLTIGICGAQGSGKSTLTAALARQLGAQGIAAATLSLDDLYLTRAERQKLAADVHPLLVTRGVPGTHDVALGLATLEALSRGEAAPLPRFDKARDDRARMADWPHAPVQTRVLLLEGWCLGARPQDAAELARQVNALETEEDPQAIWRRHVNTVLAGSYQQLFAWIDRLVLLAAPDWETVGRWRAQQEAELRAQAPANAVGVMDAARLTRFLQHYERLTRHILAEMPPRADLLVQLGPHREWL